MATSHSLVSDVSESFVGFTCVRKAKAFIAENENKFLVLETSEFCQLFISEPIKVNLKSSLMYC